MKNFKTIALFFVFTASLTALISCKKETIKIIKTETIIQYKDSILVIDTIIGRPYQWMPIHNNSQRKLLDIGQFCWPCTQKTLNVYWGSGGSWMALPNVVNDPKIAVSYQWSDSQLAIFSYGDSIDLADRNFWNMLKFDRVKIKIAMIK